MGMLYWTPEKDGLIFYKTISRQTKGCGAADLSFFADEIKSG